jgi:hypothetical protein
MIVAMNPKRRARLAAGATVLGLGALGAAALGTNPGMPAATTAYQARSGSAPITTGASGSTVPAAAQPPALGGRASGRAPIVTGASGVGAPASETDD